MFGVELNQLVCKFTNMNKTKLIQLLILTLFLHLMPDHLFAQHNSARNARLESFSGLYEGTIFTPGYCATNVATAKIYIDVTANPPVMYIDGVRATVTGMTADTLMAGPYTFGYFSKIGEEIQFFFYYELDWDDEFDDEPSEQSLHTWKKVKALKDAASHLKGYEQTYNEAAEFWNRFLAALDKGDTNLLRPFIAIDFKMWSYDYEDIISPEYPVTAVWQTMEMNREMLLDFLFYEMEEEEADEESVEEVVVEIPETYSDIIGNLAYFGDSDNCFPGAFVLYDAPVSLFVKKISNQWQIYFMQDL